MKFQILFQVLIPCKCFYISKSYQNLISPEKKSRTRGREDKKRIQIPLTFQAEMLILNHIFLISFAIVSCSAQVSVTTASGTRAPKGLG